MMQQFPPDIQALIQAQMASGNYQSQEDLFRVALAHLAEQDPMAEQDVDIRAINESIDDLEAGDPGVPLDAAFDSLRAKYNIPADA
jgi:hypothetical protein